MAGEDPTYLAAVEEMPCHVCNRAPAGHAHHDRYAVGVGRRADDSQVIPLCPEHHRALHDGGPPFRAWTREQRRQWAAEAIQATLARYARSLAPGEIPF